LKHPPPHTDPRLESQISLHDRLVRAREGLAAAELSLSALHSGAATDNGFGACQKEFADALKSGASFKLSIERLILHIETAGSEPDKP